MRTLHEIAPEKDKKNTYDFLNTTLNFSNYTNSIADFTVSMQELERQINQFRIRYDNTITTTTTNSLTYITDILRTIA